jgi:uncharacterized membrane protein
VSRGPLLCLLSLLLLHTTLAAVVSWRDPVAVLFATRGLADPVGVAAMLGLVLARLGLVFGGPPLLVLALAGAVPDGRAGG